MSEDIKVIKCVKIEEEDAKKMDPAKIGLMLTGTPQGGEVEGQYRYYGWTQCPHCGNVGRSPLDTERYLSYRCGSCGGCFSAIG